MNYRKKGPHLGNSPLSTQRPVAFTFALTVPPAHSASSSHPRSVSVDSANSRSSFKTQPGFAPPRNFPKTPCQAPIPSSVSLLTLPPAPAEATGLNNHSHAGLTTSRGAHAQGPEQGGHTVNRPLHPGPHPSAPREWHNVAALWPLRLRHSDLPRKEELGSATGRQSANRKHTLERMFQPWELRPGTVWGRRAEQL